jgi:hypothetical protein
VTWQHAATPKTGTLQQAPNPHPNGADSHTALIPTLTGVFLGGKAEEIVVMIVYM